MSPRETPLQPIHRFVGRRPGIVLFAVLLTAQPAPALDLKPTRQELLAEQTWFREHFLDGKLKASQAEPIADLPISFVYGGQSSDHLLAAWPKKTSSQKLDSTRTQYTMTWIDPRHGLEVRGVLIEYSDFPVAEWTLWFRNGGRADTPVLENIQALDAKFVRGTAGEFVLHGNKGDWCVPQSYEPYELCLGPNANQRFVPDGGRPTNGPKGWPYFNLQMPGGGVIFAIGWPGQWACAFLRDGQGGLRVVAGQEWTQLVLKPGEEIRTPLIATLFWQGLDTVRAQNLWRRWFRAHNVPRLNGQSPPPMLQMQCYRTFEKGGEQDLFDTVNEFFRAGIPFDLCWRDAGWYPCRGSWPNTGTWELDPQRYPQGWRPFSDWLHAQGKKFIVWFEPERVGDRGSWLAQNHPDWLVGGNLLNLGHPAAWKWLVEHIDGLLVTQGIDYYRQDFNLDPLGNWRSHDTPNRRGLTEIKHVMGYLAFWDELRRRHPGLLIDSCASGGRRNDLETLRRAVPLLRSDFQFGHEATTPNQGHTYGISSWIPYYGSGCYFTDTYSARSYIMPCSGYAGTNAETRRAYTECRLVAPYMLGDFYPLTPYSIQPGDWIAWQFDRPELGGGVVQAFRHDQNTAPTQLFRLHALAPSATYTITDLDGGAPQSMTGKELMDAGLSVTIKAQPGSAVILYRKAARVSAGPEDFHALVGQPADIAPSAYFYRADRKPAENAPESWFALMRYARQPLNQPADLTAPAIKQALCALLWEEIRPLRRLELTWGAEGQPRPLPAQISITTLNREGTASSWWNNLVSGTPKLPSPQVSADRRTYTYELPTETCGLVISVNGDKLAADYAVPTVRALVAETWKQLDFELEWGFEPSAARRDYAGRIEVYDGRLTSVAPLGGDASTALISSTSWSSAGSAGPRRGIQASLLYLGTSKWRRVQPFTTQPDDVARTIVTVWTKAGNFSFLAGDLENGPVLAPEYGFFVRRTSELAARLATEPPPDLRKPRILFTERMSSIAGNNVLRGWGSDRTPWFGGNPSDQPRNAQGIALPPHRLAMHPGPEHDVAVGWCSPVKTVVRVRASVAHAQNGGNGIEWWIVRENRRERKTLAHGSTDGAGSQKIPTDPQAGALGAVAVEPGALISLVIGPKGAHQCDTTLIDLVLTEEGQGGRTWNLTHDVLDTLHAGNPHRDSRGATNVWHFYCEKAAKPEPLPAEPPIELASRATSAREFIQERQRRHLSTIRQRLRAHAEQTWEGAVTAMRGANLPPYPTPPAGFEPVMKVQVPSARLTAQWNLGTWHLLRHAQKNPQTGRLWFNDYPYGILAAETYLMLAALDLMGSHQAAADGFEQWVSLPLDSKTTDHPGHHPWALLDRPNGLFSEGHGCLTHAIGPPGAGGHMDGVHAFGPGSIGWALIEHYLLTGDTNWFRAAAPRIQANAEWMLRQRRVMREMVPGGERLWCKGLQPALQVTPDSGGLWMQFYECEAYYWVSVAHFADALATIDPVAGAQLQAAAAAYRRDLRAAVERSIALSPVVPVRDGTFHSVIPFACYVRGLATGAWGWRREGSGSHVGPLYWETVQSAAALISPAGLLSPDDVRVQGYLDVLEDRLLLENPYVVGRDWFAAGWQYQGGLERTSNMHLADDDIPVFLRSFLNSYAIDILPANGYVFNEHAVHGPPDKVFEEAAFLERFRNLLVMEQGDSLWLARATPRAWLAQGQRIKVQNASTHFGPLAYEIISDVDHGQITAHIEIPVRNAPNSVLLRLRHPRSGHIQRVTANGQDWPNFDNSRELIQLDGFRGPVAVTAQY